MIGLVRKVVAGPKKKTFWNDIELDLTYITQRIIAMAFPATGFEKIYRNSIDDIAEYFRQKHKNQYLIINVSMRKYDYSMFENRVLDYFWPDHQAPPLTVIMNICSDILNFMQKCPQGVVAVHCNHGKGRTGTCIISYFIMCQQIYTAKQALRFYNKRRFQTNTYGVDQPCQTRYLNYVEQVIKMPTFPERLKHSGFDDPNSYYLQVSSTRSCQIKHDKLKLNQILKNNHIPLMADIFVELYEESWVFKDLQAVRINFNLHFLKYQKEDDFYFIQFHGKDICVNGKRDRNFSFALYFEPYCECDQKPMKSCKCALVREIQDVEWNKMGGRVNKFTKFSKKDLKSFVFGEKQQIENVQDIDPQQIIWDLET